VPTPSVPTPSVPTPSVPTPSPAGHCTVDPNTRVSCGSISSREACQESPGGCCWSQVPITALWCFKPANASFVY
jgi:hypothetical protein